MIKNILTVLVSIVIALALSEIGLRIAGVSNPIFDDYDPVRGVRLRPGKQGWYRKEGLAYLSINSMGYRDIEHSQKKSPRSFRIAVLGDSFTEARQVPREDTFWNRMEFQLAECRLFENKHIEVMNFGIGGYNTTQEMLTLKRDALKFSPDVVMVALFAGNDVKENSKALARRRSWKIQAPYHVYENGVLVLDSKFQVPLWRRALYEGTHRSRLLELVNRARRAWAVRRMREVRAQPAEDIELGTSERIYAPPREQAWREAWSITEQLLLRMRDISVAEGSKFVVVTIPTSIQVHPDRDRRTAFERRMELSDLFYPDRRIAALGEQHGFAVITAGERMQEIAEARNIYFHGFENTVLGKGHLNSEGHRVVSNILTEGLCKEGVLNAVAE